MPRHPILPTLLLLSAMIPSVGAAETPPAMPAAPAPHPPVPTHADVAYGAHPHQLMDVHLPAEGRGPFPVLIWYGGVWEASKHAPDLNRFHPHGIAVIAVETRTLKDAVEEKANPPVSYLLDDACRAVQFVRWNAARWNLDPERIAVGGGSQGTLPALYVGCVGDRADARSSDPVARVSTQVTCVAAYRSQPTIDPQRMQEWVPGVQWGAPALGCSFEESLERRAELLPIIRQWSPDALLHRGAAPIYFENEWGLTQPENITEGNYKVHSPAWALGFQKLAQQAGAVCYAKFPGHPTGGFKDIWDFIVQELQPSPKEITNSIGMKLVRVAPGSFTMGQDGPPADYNVKAHAAKFDDADWDERPAHRVTIGAAFSIGATEVTLGQYRQFNPQHAGNRGADDDAVTGVSWDEAVKFCAWLSAKEKRPYRLPTEAEWEYACRAGTTTLFHTGDRLPDGFHPWFADLGLRDRFFPEGKLPSEYRAGPGSLRVAQTPANAWGLYDLHGNVAEWCADWYGPYEAAEQTDPLGRSDGDFRVIRGGSHSVQTRLLRSANRSAWLPQTSNEKTGFRVVRGEGPRGQTLPPITPLHARDVRQSVATIEARPADAPFFAGPQAFVKIPPNSFGPLFSGHNHSPAIAECPNGDLLAVWYSCVDEAGTELNNLASRLRRGSTEWEPASLFWDGADVNDHASKLWWDGERTLFHFARGLTENIVRTSTDNGATWSKARAMQPMGEFGNAPIRTREGAMVITHDATITSLNLSRDGGATWTFPAIAEKKDARRDGSPFRHAGIHAPIVQLADGRLMTVGRLNSEAEQAKFGFKTPMSFSGDWGATWTHAATEFPAISSVQRAVLLRLREGALLLCSFTDMRAHWKERKGITFKAADGSEFTGYGLFAAVSLDDGKTWPVRKLITPGGPERSLPSIDRSEFILGDTMAESGGYLAATQTRDGHVQLISSKNHYVFNLAWLKQLPPAPKK